MEIAIDAVFNPPTKVRNPSSPTSPTTLVAMIAACPDPKPGKKAATKPIPDAADTDLVKFFLERDNGTLFCFGITDFCRRLSMSIDRPNNPDNNGNKGCFRFGILNTNNPNEPDNRKTTKLCSHFFSLKII